VTPRQVLQRPRPRRRGSGLPSPVLKLAWQRMHTYIFELDIMGLTPGSAFGRAAVYSACVWRSFGPALVSGAGVRRVVIADWGRGWMPGSSRSVYCPRNAGPPHSGLSWIRGGWRAACVASGLERVAKLQVSPRLAGARSLQRARRTRCPWVGSLAKPPCHPAASRVCGRRPAPGRVPRLQGWCRHRHQPPAR